MTSRDAVRTEALIHLRSVGYVLLGDCTFLPPDGQCRPGTDKEERYLRFLWSHYEYGPVRWSKEARNG